MGEHRGALRWAVLASVVAVVSGALAAGLRDGGRAPLEVTDTTVAVPVDEGPTLDWARKETVDLGGGWAVTDTEGDGPLLTVLRDGRPVGIVEHLDFPLETSADGERAALDAHVAKYLRDLGDDRGRTPITGYRFLPDAPEHLVASDGAVVRYGFRGTLPDGSPSERIIQWAGIRDGRLVLVAASAYDEGGLFAREGSEFTSGDLDAVAERLDRLVRASGLPDPS